MAHVGGPGNVQRARTGAAREPTGEAVKQIFWISYDLGVSGDYEGLYAWLDTLGAVECGDSFAFVEGYEVEHELLTELRADIKQNVRTDKRTRIYIVRGEDGKPKGKFLIGGRKSAPWSGYAPRTEAGTEDEA
jgi:hypothetical protein